MASTPRTFSYSGRRPSFRRTSSELARRAPDGKDCRGVGAWSTSAGGCGGWARTARQQVRSTTKLAEEDVRRPASAVRLLLLLLLLLLIFFVIVIFLLLFLSLAVAARPVIHRVERDSLPVAVVIRHIIVGWI